MFKPPYAEDRTYGGVRGSGETIVSHSLLDFCRSALPVDKTKKDYFDILMQIPLGKNIFGCVLEIQRLSH